MAIYMLGHDHGQATLMPQLRQAQHDAERLYIAAMNPADRAAEIIRRMDAIDTTDLTDTEAVEARLHAAQSAGELGPGWISPWKEPK